MGNEIWTISIVLLVSGTLTAAPIDFRRDVQPILAQHCVNCHNPQKAKGGIRLDTATAIVDCNAVVPGNSRNSILFNCLTGAAGTSRMPPKGSALTAPQMTVIKNWIDEGAKATVDGGGAGGPSAKPANAGNRRAGVAQGQQGQGFMPNRPDMNEPNNRGRKNAQENLKRQQEIVREQQKKLEEWLRERQKQARERMRKSERN